MHWSRQPDSLLNAFLPTRFEGPSHYKNNLLVTILLLFYNPWPYQLLIPKEKYIPKNLYTGKKSRRNKTEGAVFQNLAWTKKDIDMELKTPGPYG